MFALSLLSQAFFASAALGAAIGLTPESHPLTVRDNQCFTNYTIKSGDSCAAIASANHINLKKFYGLNPQVSRNCGLYLGDVLCVNGTAPEIPSTVSGVYAPFLTWDGTPQNCSTYYFVDIDDTIATITTKFPITVAQFDSWNPAYVKDGFLYAGVNYCVAVS